MNISYKNPDKEIFLRFSETKNTWEFYSKACTWEPIAKASKATLKTIAEDELSVLFPSEIIPILSSAREIATASRRETANLPVLSK